MSLAPPVGYSSLTRGGLFLGADSGVEAATLWNNLLIIGGQTGGWAEREVPWVHDRLPFGPHEGRVYSGYWAWDYCPSRVVAESLHLTGTAEETLSDGWPLARVNAGATMNAAWETKFGDEAQGITWETRLLRAANGTAYSSDAGTFSTQANGSYLLRVRPVGIVPAYLWPPPDFEATTGLKPDSVTLRWKHPTLGTVYYHPESGDGAVPYDNIQADQGALMAREVKAKADGTFRKMPAWTIYRITFNPDGTPQTRSGEYSMLRVRVGSGAWIGDTNVHSAATLPALWKAPFDALDPPTLPVVSDVWMLDPTLRNIASLEGIDGALEIGGYCASRSGPMPIALRVTTESLDEANEARNGVDKAKFYCECATHQGKGIRSAAKANGKIRFIGLCDHFARDGQKLIPALPGGRNAVATRDGQGREAFYFSAEAGDFVTTQQKNTGAYGYLVRETQRGLASGAPLAKQLDSCLTSHGGFVYGVEEQNAGFKMAHEVKESERAQAWQWLGRSRDGAAWEHLADWRKSDFDAGPVCHAGNLQDGASVWIFGTTGEGLAMRPLVYRARIAPDGVTTTRNLRFGLFPQRVETVRVGSEEWMIGVGLPFDAETGFNPRREQHVFLMRGDTNGRKVCSFWNEGAKQFRMSRAAFVSVGGDVAKLPPFLKWQPMSGYDAGGVWVPALTLPTSGSYLSLSVTNLYLAFGLPSGVARPYDFEGMWDKICFSVQDDGGIGNGPFEPEPTCPDADCVLDKMPVGTQVSVISLPQFGATLEGDLNAVALSSWFGRDGTGGDDFRVVGRELSELYPFLWLRVLHDGDEPLLLQDGAALSAADHAKLQQANQRLRWELDKSLAVATQKNVEAVILLPPGYRITKRDFKARG